MANSKTLVWQFRTSALNPLPRSQLGYVQVPQILAESLVADGSAQWPRIGAFRFNFIEPRPWETGQEIPPPEFPDTLFGASDGGGVIAVNQPQYCVFQDSAGRVPVTSYGQQVRAVRARNRPTFLMMWDPTSLAVTYEEDPQGFPVLRAASAANGWAYFRKRDGGIPITEFSIVLSAMGRYGPNQVGVGTGWSVMGDADGVQSPYSYSGVYTVLEGDSAEARLTLDSGYTSFQIAENIDLRPYVFSSRMSDGDSRFQVNLEPVYNDLGVVAEFVPPVGVDFWISPDDYWYGGVFISRDLSDYENYNTQVWCGNLAGITLVGPVPFHPTDLILPGDIGGFYDAKDWSSLFQTRTGPTVPVTGNNQPVQFITDQNGQLNLSRPLVNVGFNLVNNLLQPVNSATQVCALTTANLPQVFAQCTMVNGGYIDPAFVTDNAMRGQIPRTTLSGAAVGFGGATIGFEPRATPLLTISSWLAAGAVNLNLQVLPETLVGFTGHYSFGVRFDAALPNQKFFWNSQDFEPVLAYESPVGNGLSYQVTPFMSNDPTVTDLYGFGSTFFINRWLSDAELDQLKAWMRDNTPTP